MICFWSWPFQIIHLGKLLLIIPKPENLGLFWGDGFPYFSPAFAVTLVELAIICFEFESQFPLHLQVEVAVEVSKKKTELKKHLHNGEER